MHLLTHSRNAPGQHSPAKGRDIPPAGSGPERKAPLKWWGLIMCWLFSSASALAEIPNFQAQEIAADLQVGYATSLADMNADGRQDIVVVDSNRVLWFENPSWQRTVLAEDQTKKDNVCVAPHDIDGDGRMDLALGADWRPFDTTTGGTIQWLTQEATGTGGQIYQIGTEPTVHRIRWADLDGDGASELVVVPLLGRGSTRPLWSESAVRVLAFSVPADPRRDPWPVKVLDESLHVTHNFWPTDLDRDGRLDLLIVSYEGVSLLTRSDDGTSKRTLLGAGNQETAPDRGASEVRHGKLRDDMDYIATIEPWHGFQVVVYLPPGDRAIGQTSALWRRIVLDEELKWGHALACADLDGDSDEELVVGVRDDKSDTVRRGVRVYDPPQQPLDRWRKLELEPGAVAVEDLAAGDLDGDGDVDIVASGRQTHNVRIYWNQAVRSADN